MARYNINLFGEADDFFKKLPKRRKSIALNAIISFALKDKKIIAVLRNSFTEDQLNKIFNKSKERKSES